VSAAGLADPREPRPSPAVRPRLGFLGVGWIGRNRLEAVAAAGAAEVAAVADTCGDLARDAAAAHPGAHVAADLEEMLALGLDGVVIATPNALHVEQCLAVLRRGAAVFCQKPLARTAGETARIVEAARAADRRLGVDLSYRYAAGMQQIRTLFRSGLLGEVFSVDLVFHNAYGPDKPWFYDKRLAGGGCVLDLGIHLVDLALWTLDFPAVADVRSRRFAGGRRLDAGDDDVEDFAVAELGLETGAAVRLACSWRLSAGCDAVIEAAFHGTKGAARFHNVNGSFYDLVAEHHVGTRSETLSTLPDLWGGRALVDWAQALAAGGRFDPESERHVELARVLDAIYER
jgi:predicted dehydrogenase